MPFFKPGEEGGDRDRRAGRMEALVWVFVYGGLLTLLLGVFMEREQEGTGGLLIVGGVVATAIGALLLYLRSRLPPS